MKHVMTCAKQHGVGSWQSAEVVHVAPPAPTLAKELELKPELAKALLDAMEVLAAFEPLATEEEPLPEELVEALVEVVFAGAPPAPPAPPLPEPVELAPPSLTEPAALPAPLVLP